MLHVWHALVMADQQRTTAASSDSAMVQVCFGVSLTLLGMLRNTCSRAEGGVLVGCAG
jgi:hypothetical protein